MQTISSTKHTEQSIENGLYTVQKLGESLIKRVEKWEANGVETPFNVMTLKTPFYEIQLNYFGEDSAHPFVVLDRRDVDSNKPHAYEKYYFGSPEALIFDILSEILWIDYLHLGERD